MRLPQDIRAPCRPFARRADLIIACLIMTRQTHAAHRIAAAVPSQIPSSIIVMLASQALSGLPKNLDSPCISLAPRTGATKISIPAKRPGDVKVLDRPPAELAQRIQDIASSFTFADAPSAALCLSILGIMPPSLASKHALDIANIHGSKLVCVLPTQPHDSFISFCFTQFQTVHDSILQPHRGFNAHFRYSSASLSSGDFMLVINSVSCQPHPPQDASHNHSI